MPHNVRKVVVLPAPFGPSNPRICPGSTEKLRFFTAVKPLYFFLKFVTVIICSLLNMLRFAHRRAGWSAVHVQVLDELHHFMSNLSSKSSLQMMTVFGSVQTGKQMAGGFAARVASHFKRAVTEYWWDELPLTRSAYKFLQRMISKLLANR